MATPTHLQQTEVPEPGIKFEPLLNSAPTAPQQELIHIYFLEIICKSLVFVLKIGFLTHIGL